MRRSFKWEALPAALIALPVLAPLLVVILGAFEPDPEIWEHLRRHVLTELVANSLLLALGVGAGSLCLGVSAAWITTVYDFPGRRFFAAALVLPLACPAYVLGFVHIGLWDYTGPVQTAWRGLGLDGAAFPRVRSMGGAVAVLSLALYPYIYLLARGAFLSHGARMSEAAASLGLSRAEAFVRLLLPLSRPWLAGGTLLVAMETLADFGTVALFNIDTFTTAIYKSWFSLFSLPTAQLLAALLSAFMLLLILSEPVLRGGRRYASTRAPHAASRVKLRGIRVWAAIAPLALILAMGIVAPLIQLGWWTATHWRDIWDARYLDFIRHTAALGLIAGLCVTVLALALALSQKHLPRLAGLVVTRLACLGYAIPGTVLAVGLFIPFAHLDRVLAGLTGASDPMLRSSVLALVAAFVARFLAVGFQPVAAGLARISPSVVDAARSLGSQGLDRLLRVDLPLLKAGLLTALLMTAVDVMKEMPITLMMRPFGWDTLSTRVFELTSEGQWELASFPALLLIAAGLVPVAVLIRAMEER